MKICPKCGAQGDGIFCVACGSPMSESTTPPAPTSTPDPTPQHSYTPTPTPTQQPYTYYPPQTSSEEPMSVGGWIGRSLIPLIPGVGWLIYLIMLFVWMGDKTKEASFRNWAKAQLIVMAIAVGLAVLLTVLIVVFGISMAGAVNSYY